LPKDFAPWATVYWYFARWRSDGSLDRLHDALRDAVRRAEGREDEPSAGIIDAQSVKGSATVGAASRGYDAGKKVNGRKRHVVVDTLGLLMLVMVTTASVQDRDGGRLILAALAKAHPTVAHVWADGGYAGKLVEWAKATARIALEIVRKTEGQHGFEVLPRRWVVERTLSWITACRRLDRDYERLAPDLRGDGQVGHDRPDDPTTRTRARPPTVEHPTHHMNPSQTRSEALIDGRASQLVTVCLFDGPGVVGGLGEPVHSAPVVSHLRRQAFVYVRQSTPAQLERNVESTARQYALVEHAVELGFAREQVVVIDEDLGISGSGLSQRSGFARLTAEVALGHAGLVLGLEASRLARNNVDWYRLLDLCGVTDTVIGDADGLYHPGSFNDRLLLGLKGTMSEAELHVLRSRLQGGIRNKAARGELRRGLPVGLLWGEADGEVLLHPDEAIRGAIAVIFERFAELGSARQVWLWLRREQVQFALVRFPGSEARWVIPTYHPHEREGSVTMPTRILGCPTDVRVARASGHCSASSAVPAASSSEASSR